jgi:3D (Asp-Asp-Asp) domain-containing protein
MKHTTHKRIAHFKKRYKHIAAAFVGAILISSSLLPGIPMASVDAAVNPNIGNTRDTSSQKMKNESREESSAKINSNKAPYNGPPSKVSGSMARNLIRRNLNLSNTLSPASRSPRSTYSYGTPRANKDKQEAAVPRPNNEKKQSRDIPNNYEKVLDIRATAYAPGPLDNDQWGDKTYMGTTIRPGVVAVDPKVIPLGSRLYVKYPDGHGEYVVAEDTGGAIKGNRIDIAMMNRGKATDFGIQDVKVYVVNTPEKK